MVHDNFIVVFLYVLNFKGVMKVKIILRWMYQTKGGITAPFQSEQVTPKEAMLLYEDILKTGRVKSIEMTDQYDSNWSIKELKKYCEEMKSEPSHIKVYFDASYLENTQEAGLGIVIYYEQNGEQLRLRKNARADYIYSINEAEYAALYFALEELSWLQAKGQEIDVLGDSQVVIQQLSGEWPVYEQALERWANKTDDLLEKLKLRPNYMHISRKQNDEADRLASQALQDIQISATTSIN